MIDDIIKKMDVTQTILKRRSIRNFKEEEVTQEEIDIILESARWAPSGLNNQPWNFKVVSGDDKNKIAQHTKYSKIIKSSNKCILIFLDKKESYNYVKDVQACGACIQNMLLEITNLGLGGVWLGEIINQKEQVNKTLGISDDFELMAVIALGHPLSASTSDRKKIDDLML